MIFMVSSIINPFFSFDHLFLVNWNKLEETKKLWNYYTSAYNDSYPRYQV